MLANFNIFTLIVNLIFHLKCILNICNIKIVRNILNTLLLRMCNMNHPHLFTRCLDEFHGSGPSVKTSVKVLGAKPIQWMRLSLDLIYIVAHLRWSSIFLTIQVTVGYPNSPLIYWRSFNGNGFSNNGLLIYSYLRHYARYD